MRSVLTERREQICAFLHSFVQDEQWPPTLREIAVGVQLQTPSVIKHHLDKLIKAEYVERGRGKGRLRLTPKGRAVALDYQARLEQREGVA